MDSTSLSTRPCADKGLDELACLASVLASNPATFSFPGRGSSFFAAVERYLSLKSATFAAAALLAFASVSSASSTVSSSASASSSSAARVPSSTTTLYSLTGLGRASRPRRTSLFSRENFALSEASSSAGAFMPNPSRAGILLGVIADAPTDGDGEAPAIEEGVFANNGLGVLETWRFGVIPEKSLSTTGVFSPPASAEEDAWYALRFASSLFLISSQEGVAVSVLAIGVLDVTEGVLSATNPFVTELPPEAAIAATRDEIPPFVTASNSASETWGAGNWSFERRKGSSFFFS
mmetsp:Transcript_4587/g.19676  ORF Transcript_4587/g.19676 Transcript_4587/m.19676 type:complete len:293 (-) Transcript_4587:719-1597(-)